MMDQPVGRLATGLLTLGALLAGLGVAELARTNPAFQPWVALVLLGIGVALVLGSVITLIVLVPLARRKKAAPEPKPQPRQTNIVSEDSPGKIVSATGPITQYFGVQPPDTSPPTNWLGRPPPSLGAGFVGRETDLDAISDAFDTHNAVVVYSGAGSVKSRLAAEYTHQAEVQGFWTTAGSSVVETLVTLGATLGVRMTARSNEETAGEIGGRLAELPPKNLWVIDNLDNIEQVTSLLSESGGVRLLITTRDSRSHLLSATVAHHRTEALSQQAAIDLLCSRSQSEVPADHPTLALIVEKVGRLPLALEVLAARLGETRRTPKSILDQLERAPTAIQMDAFQEASGASIPRPEAEGVFAAIAGTLDDLIPENRAALAGLAYIADAPVPDLLATALTGLDGEGLTDLLSRCSRQSILSWSDGLVSAHALTIAALAATNPKGSPEVALTQVSIRLTEINTDDPVALRAELVHYDAMHSQAQVRLGPDGDPCFRLATAWRSLTAHRGAPTTPSGCGSKILKRGSGCWAPSTPPPCQAATTWP